MAETEDFLVRELHPVDDDIFKEPMRKRRRSDRDQRFRAFPSVEQSALKEYEKLESRTRRVLSNTYQKLIQSVFLDDSIPNSVKYLINRLLALIEKPSLDPIYIGLFGSTGAGKSSLINAIIQQAMFLPVSGESICTSCIVQVSSGCCEQYEAKIHLLSDQVRAACLLPSFSPSLPPCYLLYLSPFSPLPPPLPSLLLSVSPSFLSHSPYFPLSLSILSSSFFLSSLFLFFLSLSLSYRFTLYSL